MGGSSSPTIHPRKPSHVTTPVVGRNYGEKEQEIQLREMRGRDDKEIEMGTFMQMCMTKKWIGQCEQENKMIFDVPLCEREEDVTRCSHSRDAVPASAVLDPRAMV